MHSEGQDKIRVLFVCLGNICRSPLAEAIVHQRARERGMDRRFRFASAGTGDWHVGSGADIRSVLTARKHGLDLSSHHACQLITSDIRNWHWFVVMDAGNRSDLLAMGARKSRVLMMRQFESAGAAPADVPDPYYEGEHGFDRIYAILMKNADLLLDYLDANN